MHLPVDSVGVVLSSSSSIAQMVRPDSSMKAAVGALIVFVECRVKAFTSYLLF
jgi:hypothetical protein